MVIVRNDKPEEEAERDSSRKGKERQEIGFYVRNVKDLDTWS